MKKSLILTPVVMCFLSACNGGSGSDSSSNSVEGSSPETVKIETFPIQSKGLVSEEVAIDVLATNDVNAVMEVTSVRSMSGDSCQVTSIDEQSFTTSSDEVGECQYEYTVAPQNSELYVGEESSIARVSVSETAVDNTLPNLAETTDIDTPVVIDLSQELAEELDTSVFYLSSDASVLGAGIVDSDAANNVLTFTPFEVGVSRITYSMTDGSVTKLGTIDVAISDTQNTPPVALNFVREGKLDKGMLVTIDLTDYISDAEDAVILESVRAYNAEAEITSASEHTFTFRSSEPGAYEVAYTINDGRGGYAVGQVYLEVEPDFSLIQDWEDIVTYDPVIDTEIRFFAPMTKVYADYVNASYTSTYTENGEYGLKFAVVVTQTLAQARQYCKVRDGRLPLQRELETLISNETSAFSNHNWPTTNQYWTAENVSETNAATVNLNDGLIGNQSKDVAIYTTCVDLSNEAVSDFSVLATEQSVVSNEYVYRIEVLHPDGGAGAYQDVKVEDAEAAAFGADVFGNGASSISLVMDSEGTQRLSYYVKLFSKKVIAAEVGSTTELFPFVPFNMPTCEGLAGECIDIFDTGSGQLFTSSPSVAYLNSIGGSATNGIQTEGQLGSFYEFDWNNANQLCNTYNTNGVGGRTNWRLAERDELQELFDVYDSGMFLARGWPVYNNHFSATRDDSNVNNAYTVSKNGAYFSVATSSGNNYASCISNP
ncbi:DUF1566 domain-containing protein [Vibrio hyugaensis]|uniref:Lcl domain-containing protein n=1 Tax=Vibrio hyugaensis TaxID=1534743 RepID=UPI000CE2D189|nr:DUF1566 domain-containing protein [Vibrio hyugaensis]